MTYIEDTAMEATLGAAAASRWVPVDCELISGDMEQLEAGGGYVCGLCSVIA